MAVVPTVTSNSVAALLEDSVSAGTVKTVSVSIGRLAKTGFDAQKAVNIVNALSDCLSKDLYEIQHTQKSRLIEE